MDAEASEIPLSDLQKKADDILSGLRDVDENIRKVTGRNYSELNRGFNNRFKRKRIARDRLPGIDNTEASSSTTVKSVIQAPIVPPVEAENQITVLSEVVAPTEHQSLPPPKQRVEVTDEETSLRAKKMFSHLMGTLTKSRIENENFKEQSIKRQEIEKKLEERATKEHEESIKKKRELLQLRREKQRDLSQLRRKIWVKELEESSVEYFDVLSVYIATTTQPTILFTPHQDNDVTARLKEGTKAMFEKRKQEFSVAIPEFTLIRKEDEGKKDDAEEENHQVNEHTYSSQSSSNEEEEEGEGGQKAARDDLNTDETTANVK